MKRKKNKRKKSLFKERVLAHYKLHGRDLPWRKTQDPYAVFISEIMLQQTQVDRVIPKYKGWLKKFPDFSSIAEAPLAHVLSEWKGLGYNRRALHLHKASGIITKEYGGNLPQSREELLTLPGVGSYASGALLCFVWNKPAVFFETNIRTAFIHHFFKNAGAVSDKEIQPIAEAVLDTKNPREWYWALMDYGAHIKKERGNVGRHSRHYTTQSPFKGSNRQVRSKILSFVLKEKETTEQAIQKALKDERIEVNVNALLDEGFLEKREGIISIHS